MAQYGRVIGRGPSFNVPPTTTPEVDESPSVGPGKDVSDRTPSPHPPARPTRRPTPEVGREEGRREGYPGFVSSNAVDDGHLSSRPSLSTLRQPRLSRVGYSEESLEAVGGGVGPVTPLVPRPGMGLVPRTAPVPL